MCYLIVDEMHAAYPDLVQDIYWDMSHEDSNIPYTLGTSNLHTKDYQVEIGSMGPERYWVKGAV